MTPKWSPEPHLGRTKQHIPAVENWNVNGILMDQNLDIAGAFPDHYRIIGTLLEHWNITGKPEYYWNTGTLLEHYRTIGTLLKHWNITGTL